MTADTSHANATAITLACMIVMTITIIITITKEVTAMIYMIAKIATTAVTAIATSTNDNMGIAAITTSLAAILKRLMISIAIRRQRTISLTIFLAP